MPERPQGASHPNQNIILRQFLLPLNNPLLQKSNQGPQAQPQGRNDTQCNFQGCNTGMRKEQRRLHYGLHQDAGRGRQNKIRHLPAR